MRTVRQRKRWSMCCIHHQPQCHYCYYILICFFRITTPIRPELQNVRSCQRQVWFSHLSVNRAVLIKHSVSKEMCGLLFSPLVTTELMKTTQICLESHQFSAKYGKNLLFVAWKGAMLAQIYMGRKNDKLFGRLIYPSFPVLEKIRRSLGSAIIYEKNLDASNTFLFLMYEYCVNSVLISISKWWLDRNPCLLNKTCI